MIHSRLPTQLLVSIGFLLATVLSIIYFTVDVSAIEAFQNCNNAPQNTTAICKSAGTDKLVGPGSLLGNVINILITITGIISVIMIVVGGIRYVVSNGDSSAIGNAKSTVLYAVVGLVIAVLAYAIVNFVLSRI